MTVRELCHELGQECDAPPGVADWEVLVRVMVQDRHYPYPVHTHELKVDGAGKLDPEHRAFVITTTGE